MYEKHKRKLLMMERNAEDEMYQRRKRCWLTYGRALLTIGVLGLLTLSLYAATRSRSHDEEHNSRHVFVVDVERPRLTRESVHGDEFEVRNPKIVRRSVDKSEVPKNSDSESDERAQSLNDVDSDNEAKADSEHLKLIRRQQGSNGGNLRHQHSDGVTYYFKGYKCVPVLKQSGPSQMRNNPKLDNRNRQKQDRNKERNQLRQRPTTGMFLVLSPRTTKSVTG